MNIEVNQIIKGRICGAFIVMGMRRAADGQRLIDVREIGPEGQIGQEFAMTEDCFK